MAEQFDARREILGLLLTKVQADRSPSATMVDLIEHLMRPDERSVHALVLMEKIRQDKMPSAPMMQRLLALT